MSQEKLSPAELLHRAADLIEQRGLATGSYESDDGALCALGAINMAACGRSMLTAFTEADATRRAKTRLYRHIADLPGDGQFVEITTWNDESDAATVVATLRAAAGAL